MATPVFLLCADLSAAIEQPMGGPLFGNTACLRDSRVHSLFCSPVNKIRVLFPLLLCTETDEILLMGDMGLGRTIDHCPDLTPEAILHFSQRQAD